MTVQTGIPPTTREGVMGPLWTLLQSSLLQSNGGPFVTMSRKLKLWGDVPVEEQPALFMTEHSEEYADTGINLPPKRGWGIMFWMYVPVPNDEQSPGSILLNNLMDSLEAVIVPKPGVQPLTFGGQVYRAWPIGPVHKEAGDLDGQAIAIVPFRIRPP